MELQDNLKALGERLGPEVFDDPESFRGALDDFLDEDAASTGDINLLVDAVRLGAFRSMRTMLDSGAQAGAAIEEAGARLARDRGSADVAGSQWACAVLGYAVGKVSEADVRRYRSQGAPGSMTSPVQPPAQPGSPYPGTQQPGSQQPGSQLPPTALPQTPPGPPAASPAASFPPPADPTAFSSPQTPPSQFSSNPTPSTPTGPPQGPGSWPNSGPNSGPTPPTSWGTPPPAKRRNTGMIVAAVVAVVVVIAGGIGLALALGGNDDDDKGGGGPDKQTSSGPDLSNEAINQRYLGLGSNVTEFADSCTAADLGTGETERLTCGFDQGTLTLTTFEDEATLQSARDKVVDVSQKGGVYLKTGPDVVYGFDASEDETDSVKSNFLYWDDDHAYQAAVIEASGSGTTLAVLNQLRTSTGSTLPYGSRPTDGKLIEFVNRLNQYTACERIPTKAAGETEENHCDGPQNISVYYGKFVDAASFQTYREGRDATTTANGATPDTWHFTSKKNKAIGSLDQYILEKGTGNAQSVLYWDDTKCQCYGEAYLSGEDQDALYDWWTKTS